MNSKEENFGTFVTITPKNSALGLAPNFPARAAEKETYRQLLSLGLLVNKNQLMSLLKGLCHRICDHSVLFHESSLSSRFC